VGEGEIGNLLLNLDQVVRRVADDDARRFAHENHADGIALPRILDQSGSHGLGLIEAAGSRRGVAHGERGVEHKHAVRALTGDDVAERLEEGLGHGAYDEQDQERADGQEQPLLDPHPALVLADGRQQELHGRPGHLPEPAAVEQVDDDRDRGGRQPGEQPGIGELERPEKRQ
jgi:hypothetical protein